MPVAEKPPAYAESSAAKRRTPALVEVPEFKEKTAAPFFTFPLRSRLIQKNHGCKLLCTVTGAPLPRVEWTKDGGPLNMDRVQVLNKAGVCSLEIFNARMEDAGAYECHASNELGTETTVCQLTVQPRGGGAGSGADSPASGSGTALPGTSLERSSTAMDVRLRRLQSSSSSTRVNSLNIYSGSRRAL